MVEVLNRIVQSLFRSAAVVEWQWVCNARRPFLRLEGRQIDSLVSRRLFEAIQYSLAQAERSRHGAFK
jgi:hypothetical protein